jgi:hypothetical protein
LPPASTAFSTNHIDALEAVERQAEEGLDLAFCIDDPLRSEVGEVRVAQDLEDDRIGPHHRAGNAGLPKALILYEADRPRHHAEHNVSGGFNHEKAHF